MDEKRVKEEQKQPEGESVPTGKKLEDQDLTGAAGGMTLKPQWVDDHCVM